MTQRTPPEGHFYLRTICFDFTGDQYGDFDWLAVEGETVGELFDRREMDPNMFHILLNDSRCQRSEVLEESDTLSLTLTEQFFA